MTDRSKQTLNIYKGDQLVASGEVGQTSVFVALPGGTTATDGEYQGTFKDTDGNESTKADFPAFTVPVAVTGVTMSQKTASMNVGDTKVITGTVAPANATNQVVTYKSSDEKVATVAENGTVTAVAEGSADITATTADGGFTDKCVVTVTKPTVAVTGVTIDPTTANIEVGKTAKLTANVAPANATNKAVNYKSSNEAVATVAPDGTVKAVSAGTADITVTAVDGGSNAKCAVTVTAPEAPETPSSSNLLVGADTPFTMTGTGAENEIKRMYSLAKPISKGTKVTADFDIESTKAEGNYMIQFIDGSWQVISSAPLADGKQHQSYTVTVDADYSDGIQLRLDKSTATVTVSNFTISESSK